MKKLFISYLVITIIFSVNVWLNFQQISFRGYWSDKTLALIWLFFTGFIILKYRKLALVKIYSVLIFITLFLSILPMGIPFISMLKFFAPLSTYQKINLNETYRLEIIRPILGGFTIVIYEADGILEKRVEWISYEAIDSTFDSESSFKKTIINAEIEEETQDSIIVNYQMKDYNQRFTHYISKDNPWE